MLKHLAVLATLSIALTSCSGDNYFSQFERLESFMKGKKIGMSADYWLMQYSSGRDEYDPIALFFATGDDYDFCMAIAELAKQKYPLSKYRCKPAN